MIFCAGQQVDGEANLDLQSALPIIYPQNATIFQTDDSYYAHAADYGYHGLELYNDFLDAVSAVHNPMLAHEVAKQRR
jgi:tripeptidyl-peptidase-1